MADVKPTLGIIGSYNLLKVIGRGGMGVVYQARDIKLDRLVALKMMRADKPIGNNEIERFRQESKLVANLNHPNIVNVYDVGSHDGSPYFTMEYVEGVSLSEYSMQTLPDTSRAVSIILSCCEAMGHAHQNGVIHRDLKPSNILLDRSMSPRIVDFGLAKRLVDEKHLTQSGQAIGTPAYMPPEQAMGFGKLVGPHSDVYGLGAILYSMLTGQPPIPTVATGTKNMLQRIVDDLPVSVRQLNKDIDRDLDAICLKCLEKRPSDRYANAFELGSELKRYVGGNSISARRNSYARFVRHWIRRPGRTAQSAMIILIIATFFGITVVVGLSIFIFRLVEIHEPRQFALIVSLDTMGLLTALPTSLGMFAQKRWSMWLGSTVGLGMLMIVVALIATGFTAGGVLHDAFIRLSLYTIFCFIGVVMTGASVIAWLAQGTEVNIGHESETRDQTHAETTISAAR